ncbi:MAG: hypothetical protein KAG53_10170, partial [Endozoicomonadaceae bacterium]|nr:hypothetical protein [Endozoicomonadaceae bacterium]
VPSVPSVPFVNNKNHTCPNNECDISTTDLKEMEIHVIESHLSYGNIFSCRYCSLTFLQQQQLRNHLYYQHEIDFKCKKCQSISKNNDKFMKHLHNKHNPDYKHICEICEQTFKNPLLLKKHNNSAHDKHKSIESNNSSVTIKAEIDLDVHTWSNKAPIWQDEYPDNIDTHVRLGTRYKNIDLPKSTRKLTKQTKLNLKRQIDNYIILSIDNIEKYLNIYMKDIICDGEEEAVLKGKKGVIAGCDIPKWTLLGHYAGCMIAESEASHTVHQDAYAVDIAPGWFLSGYCHGNVTSLINANTSYQEGIQCPPANASFLLHRHTNGYVVFVISTKNIPQGGSILLDYGQGYWKEKEKIIIISSDEEDTSEQQQERKFSQPEKIGIIGKTDPTSR